MSTAYAYGRVSRLEQVEAYSLDMQADESIRYFDTHVRKFEGVEFGRFFRDEGQSAFKIPLSRRQEGRKLCEIVRSGDHIIFARFNRAFRSVFDCSKNMNHWADRNIKVHFLDLDVDTTTAYGRAMLGMLAVFEEFHSAQKSEYAKEIAIHRKKNGFAVGKAPFGCRNVGPRKKRRVIPDHKKISVLRYAWHHKFVQGRTWEEITDRLEAIHAAREGRKPVNRQHPKYTISEIVLRKQLIYQIGADKDHSVMSHFYKMFPEIYGHRKI